MLEQLRTDMIVAFRVFSESPINTNSREIAWEFYCKCRENYLKAHCSETGSDYIPLKHMIVKEDGH